MEAPKLLPSRQRAAAQIFAGGDELHLLGDDALARIIQLGDVLARLGAQQLDAVAVELRHRSAFRRGFRPSSSGLRSRPTYSSTSPRARIQSRRRGGQALFDVDGRRYRPCTDRRCRTAGPAPRRPTASLRGTARRPPSACCEPGSAPRVMDSDLSRMGLFIVTSPYAGVSRIRF